MAKVSISLPNNAQVTFELEESEVVHEIVGMTMRDLLGVLIHPDSPSVDDKETKKRARSTTVVPPTSTKAEPSPIAAPQSAKSEHQAAAVTYPRETIIVEAGDTGSEPPEFLSANGMAAFEAFCREANPLGDMRRVVVAAEGANRHFGVDGVNAEDLGWLFDAANWRRPGNFTQTLRNAARSKFGWLERIPGRSGRYAATPLGLSKTLPNN